MNKRLFVAGLPYSLDDSGLKDLFSKCGNVESATVIMDRETARSKGYGFVEMVTVEDAQKAVETLNDSEIEGRKIVVNEARPKPEYSTNRGGGDSRFRQDRGGQDRGYRRSRTNRY